MLFYHAGLWPTAADRCGSVRFFKRMRCAPSSSVLRKPLRGSSDAAACVASPASAHDSALEPPPRDGTATAPRPNLAN
jgi:hypothetical protein